MHLPLSASRVGRGETLAIQNVVRFFENVCRAYIQISGNTLHQPISRSTLHQALGRFDLEWLVDSVGNNGDGLLEGPDGIRRISQIPYACRSETDTSITGPSDYHRMVPPERAGKLSSGASHLSHSIRSTRRPVPSI